MDDALTGANRIEETNQIREELTKLLASKPKILNQYLSNGSKVPVLVISPPSIITGLTYR
jgi:hypothetical protein